MAPSRFSAASWYLKVRDRHSYAFSLVSVAVGLQIADGVIAAPVSPSAAWLPRRGAALLPRTP